MCLGVGAVVALSFPLWCIFGFATLTPVPGRVVNKCLVTLYNGPFWVNIYKIRWETPPPLTLKKHAWTMFKRYFAVENDDSNQS
jgi:hypothetical protein